MNNKSSVLFKIAGILAIVIGAICCLGFIVIFPAIIGATLIIGGVKFLDFATCSREQLLEKSTNIIVWIVIFFVFGGIVTGIIALLAYLDSTEEIVYNNNVSDQSNQNLQNNKSKDSQTLVIEKLERLSSLYKEGLLTEEEYTSLKNELLKNNRGTQND